jgi:predicted RecA/RadA family phage recombinase
MAIRILPFRQYDENDVINLFSMDACNGSPSETKADAGMLVSVSARDMDKDPVELAADSSNYLGKTNYPHVARNYYPSVPLKITANDGAKTALGITLAQTLSHDENGENLLRYPQKKTELYAVTSGEAVPVATKGVFTLFETAFDTTPTTSHVAVKAGTNSNGVGSSDATGKLVLQAAADSDTIGTVLGVGTRTSQNGNTDQFDGSYAVIKLDL